MRTIVLGPPPAELEALIARRRSLGLDGYDEVWRGEYHMAPTAHPFHGYLVNKLLVLLQPFVDRAGLVSTAAFDLGQPDDFRVPDGGLHLEAPTTVYLPTALAVIEVEAPDDETWDKLGFYAEHNVAEILVASYQSRSVTWLGLTATGYEGMDHSLLLGKGTADLSGRIAWPPDPA